MGVEVNLLSGCLDRLCCPAKEIGGVAYYPPRCYGNGRRGRHPHTCRPVRAVSRISDDAEGHARTVLPGELSTAGTRRWVPALVD